MGLERIPRWTLTHIEGRDARPGIPGLSHKQGKCGVNIFSVSDLRCTSVECPASPLGFQRVVDLHEKTGLQHCVPLQARAWGASAEQEERTGCVGCLEEIGYRVRLSQHGVVVHALPCDNVLEHPTPRSGWDTQATGRQHCHGLLLQPQHNTTCGCSLAKVEDAERVKCCPLNAEVWTRALPNHRPGAGDQRWGNRVWCCGRAHVAAGARQTASEVTQGERTVGLHEVREAPCGAAGDTTTNMEGASRLWGTTTGILRGSFAGPDTCGRGSVRVLGRDRIPTLSESQRGSQDRFGAAAQHMLTQGTCEPVEERAEAVSGCAGNWTRGRSPCLLL